MAPLAVKKSDWPALEVKDRRVIQSPSIFIRALPFPKDFYGLCEKNLIFLFLYNIPSSVLRQSCPCFLQRWCDKQLERHRACSISGSWPRPPATLCARYQTDRQILSFCVQSDFICPCAALKLNLVPFGKDQSGIILSLIFYSRPTTAAPRFIPHVLGFRPFDQQLIAKVPT